MPEQRTVEEEQQALDHAVAAAEKVMRADGVTVEDVEAKLSGIQNQYDLKSIKLVPDQETSYHIEAEINPKKHSRKYDLLTKQQLKDLKKLAKRFSLQIKQKNDQSEFLADPQAYLIGNKVQIGDVVEVTGFVEVLKYTNETVLRNVYLQFVNHRGEKIGGSQAELDFVILGDVGVKEIVSAKLNPDRFVPSLDKANLRHYFAIPLHDSIQTIKYAFTNFGHVPKYNEIADVHVYYHQGGTVSSMPLQTFRSQYLRQVALDEIMVKSLTPEPETELAARGDLTLKVTSRYLISRLADEIKTAL